MYIGLINHFDEVEPSVHATTGIGTANEALGFPATATQLQRRGDVWRSVDTGGTGAALATTEWKYTFDDDRAANHLALFGHNLAGGTVRLQLYSDDAYTTSVYDSTALTPPGADAAFASGNFGLSGSVAGVADDLFGNEQPYVLYFATKVFKSAKMTITGGALATSFLSIGRIRCGMYQDVGDPSAGMAMGVSNNSSNTRTRGGSNAGNPAEVWRKVDVNIEMARFGDVERPYWYDLARRGQYALDLFISIFPGAGGRLERDHCFNGKQVQLDPLVYDEAYRTAHVIFEEQ